MHAEVLTHASWSETRERAARADAAAIVDGLDDTGEFFLTREECLDACPRSACARFGSNGMFAC
jgi:hypothetical protein